MPIVLKYGNLNLLETSGPFQACNGNALPCTFFTFTFLLSNKGGFVESDIDRAINLLAPEFGIQILAHPVCKMWIIQGPKKVAL